MIPGIIAQRIRVAADPPGPATIEILFDAGTDFLYPDDGLTFNVGSDIAYPAMSMFFSVDTETAYPFVNAGFEVTSESGTDELFAKIGFAADTTLPDREYPIIGMQIGSVD